MSKRFLAVLLISMSVHVAVASENRVFTYKLPMIEADSITNCCRQIHEDNPRLSSIIGFQGDLTAVKKLPYRIGPGKVQIYARLLPEQSDKKITITIGDRSAQAIVRKDYFRYHWAQLTINLSQAQDQVILKVENPDGKKSRIIWYETVFTNDPNWKYLKGVERGKSQRYILYVRPLPENPPGNLLPNSGFEEGIASWDMQKYRSNVMVKPSLLNRRRAHGNYSLNVGEIPIMSRSFVLKGDRKYTLTIHTAENNPVSVTGRVEAETMGSKFVKIIAFNSADKEPADIQGWNRSRFTFQTPTNEVAYKGRYRVTLQAGKVNDTDRHKAPVLVDSLQITEGKPDQSAYRPYLGLEANFIALQAQAIFTKNEHASIRFNLFSSPEVTVNNIAYTIYDYFDRCVQSAKPIKIQGHLFQQEVSINTDKTGFFRIRSRIDYVYRGKKRTRWRDFFYNVVWPQQSPTSRREKSLIGAYYVWGPSGQYSWAEIAKKFGFFEHNSLGTHELFWAAIVRGKDGKIAYRWQDADREISRFTAGGFSITHTFHVAQSGYRMPLVCRYNGNAREQYFVLDGTRQSGKERFDRALWLDYVRRFVSRYRGKISKYLIEDEPIYYFTPDEYARFYLATRKAIKEVDPGFPVFFDAYMANDTRFIDALDKATKGKAHEFMDGIHAYLDSNRQGLASKTAAVRFRKWLRQHNMPLVTATCYSDWRRLDTKTVADVPYYLDNRLASVRSIQYLLDGVVWGGSSCLYTYYGAHTGMPSGFYIFDEFGRIKPALHFYSTANHLLGGHGATASIDAGKNFRVGIIKTGGNNGVAVLYSTDGRIYDFSLPASGIREIVDAFGNPVSGWRKKDIATHYLSGLPVYLLVDDVALVRQSLGTINFQEKLPVYFTPGINAGGMLELTAWINSQAELRASACLVTDVYNSKADPEILRVKKVGGSLYKLVIPYAKSPNRSIIQKQRLRLRTNFGDLSSNYRALYAAISHTAIPGKNDGVLAPGEWPLPDTGRIPLQGYVYLPDGSKGRPYLRGNACLKLTGSALRGLISVGKTRWNVDKDFIFTLAPINTATGAWQLDKRVELMITERKKGKRLRGIVLNGNEAGKTFPVAKSKTNKPWDKTPFYEFSVPLSRIPGFNARKGACYAGNVVARQKSGKVWSWYLDAAWHRNGSVNVEGWVVLMVVE